jgi:phage terminase small subunit
MAKELTKKQKIFADEYLIDLNQTRAYIAAGYSEKGACQSASALLRNPNVAAYIAKKLGKRTEKLEISGEKVLAEIAKIAFLDPRKFFNPDGSPRDIADLDDDTAACVAGLEVVEMFDGSQGDQKHVTGLVKKIKLSDKLKALELYGRYHKLFTDKLEATGKDGAPLTGDVDARLTALIGAAQARAKGKR